MKNLLAILLMLFLSVTSFSQVAHTRAKLFNVGYKDTESNEFVWNGTPTECNILIDIKQNSVVIWSKEKQNYSVIGKVEDNNEYVMYRMSDSNGRKCNFYIAPVKDSQSVLIIIEYSDYAWLYVCSED